MIQSNITLTAQTHRIFFSSPRPVDDRTGVYITLLLLFLFFILIFYLCYNFISFKRYSSFLKNTKNSYRYSQVQRNDFVSSAITQPNDIPLQQYTQSREELVVYPSPTTSSLSMHEKLRETKKSIPGRLVSDL